MVEVRFDDTVRSVVAQQLAVPAKRLTSGRRLLDLGVTEEHAPGLLSAMGEALDVRFPDDFLDGVHTYGELTSAVKLSLGPH